MLIGYIRVSKSDGSQVLDLQRDALTPAGGEPRRISDGANHRPKGASTRKYTVGLKPGPAGAQSEALGGFSRPAPSASGGLKGAGKRRRAEGSDDRQWPFSLWDLCGIGRV